MRYHALSHCRLPTDIRAYAIERSGQGLSTHPTVPFKKTVRLTQPRGTTHIPNHGVRA